MYPLCDDHNSSAITQSFTFAFYPNSAKFDLVWNSVIMDVPLLPLINYDYLWSRTLMFLKSFETNKLRT